VLDAHSGALLKSLNLGGSLGSSVITYQVGAKQYVATLAGNTSRAGLSSGGNIEPRLVVMTTGLNAADEPTKVTAFPAAESGRLSFGADQGKAIYGVFCANCHGMGGHGGGSAPALQDESTRKNLQEVIEWIKNPAPPMPKLSPPLMDNEVEAVARYVEQMH
jgi:mono/diheme cytochrome c family protein